MIFGYNGMNYGSIVVVDLSLKPPTYNNDVIGWYRGKVVLFSGNAIYPSYTRLEIHDSI